MLEDAVDGLWDVVHNHVEVDLVLLVSLRVESVLQSDHIRVAQFFHDLQLPVLVPLVLVDLLDGDDFARLGPGGLEDDTKGAVAHDSVRVVSAVLMTTFVVDI